ncbi:S1C family serine protease [Lignipirellula cremea]|uniref:Serine protease HhoB n=1 Tax=Lignipirellula cremea TaxID=2528010 RepID=A0A518E1Y9_9BACT|nr:S1C family serine protease [Lignipirellula cremea]QDU98108.1 Putative serine protease HhoB precursor [Lignipirellula cremea]
MRHSPRPKNSTHLNPQHLRLGRETWAVLISVCLAAPLSAVAEDGPFHKAAVLAQQRTVKIYGAGIGNIAGYASGIVVSHDGQILAPQGVYLSGQRIRVVLPDGAQHEAEVLRRSREQQLALLKIPADTPRFFTLSPEPVGEQGDWVLAVSNAFKVAEGDEPLGVNLGVISLRTTLEAQQGDGTFAGEVLLIDAVTSNPGAAGGAVVTIEGRLAGMIGKVVESKTTGVRLNYAVPVEQLQRFVEEKPAVAARPASMAEPDLGLRLFTLSGRSAPAYIDRLSPDGPAARAGLKPDDLVVSVAGKTVRSVSDFQKAAAQLKPGESIELLVKRKQELVRVQLTPVARE